jgi:D-glycero-D-manno-heptose 1,7-bisphosphate phosphatase
VHATTLQGNAHGPAIFLDRDGVINRDLHYVYRTEDFHFLPGIMDACRAFVAAGFRLVVVTNQAGIARGLYTLADLEILHCWMTEQFDSAGAPLSGIYFCPHHPEGRVDQFRTNCDCRKPAPGMLLKAQRDLNIDLPRSILIGDKVSDVLAGRAAGVGRCYLVGHNPDETAEKSSEAIAVANISQIVSSLSL